VQNPGEKAFANYLQSCGIVFRFEPEHEGKRRRPDFEVEWAGQTCFLDVKDRCVHPNNVESTDTVDNHVWTEFSESEEDDDGSRLDFEPVPGGGIDPPYRWIREQIEQGRRKFNEFKGSPCAIVMFSSDGLWSDLEEPDFLLSTMYGDYGYCVPFDEKTHTFDSSRAQGRYLKNGKMIRPGLRRPQNTTISALITLRNVRIGQARLLRFLEDTDAPNDLPSILAARSLVNFDANEEHFGSLICENSFASVPFPRELLSGPYDERWAWSGNEIKRIHFGALLAEFESAHQSPSSIFT